MIRPRILHLSADYPDVIDSFKTPVIKSHIELTHAEFDHDVISINRKSLGFGKLLVAMAKGGGRPRLVVDSRPFHDGTALAYHAPGKGIFHATMLNQLGDWLTASIDRENPPDLLIGHKLGFEGIAVARAAKLTGIPYAISIQGDSDTKVLGARPDLAKAISKVFHNAALLFPFSPWALKAVEQKLGTRSGPVVMLPCPTDLDEMRLPTTGGKGLVTAFHLKNFRRKNLQGIAKALQILEKTDAAPALQVIGGGTPAELSRCQSLTSSLHSIQYVGAMDRTQLRAAMATACGFVMPSLRESFGLVFIEALFAGLPIVYPAGTAVDGYLDGLPFAIRVNPRNPAEIAAAMKQLTSEEAELKAHLTRWLTSGHAERFTRPAISRQFANGLHLAITDAS